MAASAVQTPSHEGGAGAREGGRGGAGMAGHLDVVLRLLLYETDALEHVGDVVDAPLLHPQLARGLVEIKDALRRVLYQRDELLGQQAQTAVVSTSLLLRHRLPGARAEA